MPRYPLATTALITCLATPLTAQPVTFWELFTIDRLANVAAQWGITALRSVADVTYTHMDIRPLEGRWIITGLDVQERNPWDGDGCAISVDRAVMRSAPLDQIELAGFNLDLVGVEVSRDCLDRDLVELLDMLGMQHLSLDRAGLDLSYTIASGGAEIRFYADAPGVAEVSAQSDLAYLTFDANREEPIVDFNSARIELVDDGLWAAISSEFPEAFYSEPLLRGILMSELLDTPAPITPPAPIISDNKGDSAEAPAPAPSPAPDEEDNFAALTLIDEAAFALSAFANVPGRLVVTLAAEEPIRINDEFIDAMEDIRVFSNLMSPSITYGDSDLPIAISGEEMGLISAWVDGAEIAFAPTDQLHFAQALLTGIGAPRDQALGLDLLTPLLQAREPGAIELALSSLDLLDPRDAYRIALRASAQGNRQAFAQLDRLERDLPDRAILRAQGQAGLGLETLSNGEETARELRGMALDHMVGLEARRHYGAAYTLATLALALGDEAARSILDEIDAMADQARDADVEAWQSLQAEASAAASGLWASRLP